MSRRKTREELEKEIQEGGDLQLAMAGSIAAGSEGGGGDPALAELVKQVLGKSLQDQQKKAEEELAIRTRMSQNSAQAAAASEAQERALQAACSHRDDLGATRLSGQFLSGSKTSPGRLYLTCKWCGKGWYAPRRSEKDEELPAALMPKSSEIGGRVMTTGLEGASGFNTIVPDKQLTFAPAG